MYEPHVRPSDVSRTEIGPDLVVLFPDRFQIVMLAFLALVGLGACLAAPRFIESDSAAVHLMFRAGAGFSALMALQMTWRLLRPRPVLIADTAGIADYTFSGRPVFLRWDDIGAIAVLDPPKDQSPHRRSSVTQRFLVIRPRPGAAVSEQLTGFERLVRRLKAGSFGEDGVRFSENLRPMGPETLRAHLQEVWRRHASSAWDSRGKGDRAGTRGSADR